MKDIESVLGYHFNNPDYLLRALTRSQYANDNPKIKIEYQDGLAVLGDSIIDVIVIYKIMNKMELSKGEITDKKIENVRREWMTEAARKINLQKYVRWGKGEQKDEVWKSTPPLGECLEAIVGAIFLDGGYEKCEEVLDTIDFFNKHK